MNIKFISLALLIKVLKPVKESMSNDRLEVILKTLLSQRMSYFLTEEKVKFWIQSQTVPINLVYPFSQPLKACVVIV